jgi:hypothetical protein
MPHNAEDILGQVDWDEWPDLDVFSGAESEDGSSPGDEDAA